MDAFNLEPALWESSPFTPIEKLFENSKLVVYRVQDKGSGLPRMLKMLKSQFPLPEELAIFEGEYELLVSLKDKAGESSDLITALDLDSINGRLTMILEDFGAYPLTTCMSWMDFPNHLVSALDAGLKIIEQLEIIHSLNVIHKDITPEHIYLNPETGNYSLANLLPRETTTYIPVSTLQGNLAYISPEQTGRTNRAIDYRTDMYSLGVLLYQMLTGYLPFPGSGALEIVHAHIAREPQPPAEKKPGLPVILSSLILKLMAKNPEHRYQSATGLKLDMQACREELRATGGISSFKLGRQDVSDTFQLSGKIYGRENESKRLLDSYQAMLTGSQELVLVSGHTGIGKTCLVQELFTPILINRGFFIAGKCEQFQRNSPYHAICQALHNLVKQLLAEGEDRIQAWKKSILQAAGNNARILVDMIPGLDMILGPQPEVPVLPQAESQNRFNYVFQNFIRVFCHAEHPLTLFLDDLQWIDLASLQLLELLVLDPDLQYLLLIGAYRDNEVDSAHHLVKFQSRLARQGRKVTCIELFPLSLEQSKALVADTVRQTAQESSSLAALCRDKTGGNPFFMKSFLTLLHEHGFLSFDQKHGRWIWDLNEIEKQEVTSNMGQLMAQSLLQLPQSTLELVKISAVLGFTFSVQLVSLVSGRSMQQTVSHLWVAVENNYLLPLDPRYKHPWIRTNDPGASFTGTTDFKFAHDRIQQAAYDLLSPQERAEIHMHVGRILKQKLDDSELNEWLYTLVHHLNQGSVLISPGQETQELIQANLQAALKAKQANAYELAADFVSAGIDLLPADSWERDPDLTFELMALLAEVQYLRGNFSTSERIIYQTLEHVRTSTQASILHYFLILQRLIQGRYEAAAEAGQAAFAQLQVELPTDLQAALESRLLRLEKRLQDREIASLIHLPDLVDPWARAVMYIIQTMIPVAYYTSEQLFAYLAVLGVDISLDFGNTPEASTCYCCYGIIMAHGFGRYQTGFSFGELGLKVAEKYGSGSDICRASNAFGAFQHHWCRPLSQSRDILLSGYQAGVESGELEFSGYLLLHEIELKLYTGQGLKEIASSLTFPLSFARKTGNTLMNRALLSIQALVNNLISHSGDDPCKMSVAGQDEEVFLAACHQDAMHLALFQHYCFTAYVSYLFGSCHRARAACEQAQKHASGAIGLYSNVLLNFVHSLVLANICLHSPAREQKELIARIEDNQTWMRTWMEHCPQNFSPQYLLVQAELAVLKKEAVLAAELYDQAIEAARKSGFIHHETLAHERVALFWLQQGNSELAGQSMGRAWYGYQLWGAKRKARMLRDEYKDLWSGQPSSVPGPAPSIQTDLASEMVHTVQSGSQALDMHSLFKAGQAISEEMHLPSLLGTIMHILLENAGADRGALILGQEQWCIRAVAHLPHEVRTDVDIELSSPEAQWHVPLSVIYYVLRTGQEVVLDNLTADQGFARDPYVQQKAPLSALCAPLWRQGQITTVLYLENRLTESAFTREHLHTLRVLGSQAAISIENAQLYTNMEEQVHKRTQELSQAIHRLQTEKRRLADIIEGTDVGTWELNLQTRETIFNEGTANLLGLSLEQMGADPLQTWRKAAHPEDIKNADHLVAQHLSGELDYLNYEMRVQNQSGKWVWVLVRGKVSAWTESGSPLLMSGTFQDISTTKLMELELRHMATHDQLTGLPTMRLAQEHLRLKCSLAHRKGLLTAVMFVDLDGFKQINDTYGHDKGDVLLQGISDRLSAMTRETDTVARIGGDEFLIIAAELHDADNAAGLAAKILHSLAQPMDIGGFKSQVGASIGISLYPQDGTSNKQLIQAADQAMYQAKESGKNQYVFFQDLAAE